MTDYRVLYEDPDSPDEPAMVLAPSENWMRAAMAGNLPPISVYLDLQDDEKIAFAEGQHENGGFNHNPEKWLRQFTAPRIGPLTEEQAIEYLIMKDLPRRVWAEEHNRPMFKIVTVDRISTDRTFRDAWEMAA